MSKEIKKYITEDEILDYKEKGKCIYEDSNGIYILSFDEEISKVKKDSSKKS